MKIPNPVRNGKKAAKDACREWWTLKGNCSKRADFITPAMLQLKPDKHPYILSRREPSKKTKKGCADHPTARGAGLVDESKGAWPDSA